ncbi:glycosyltransferase family 39 protein [Bacillus cytotoxicus]|uniref:Glycosyltransferase family 39 protein n=1 Tax=Bacillus cytotoxicus TaxID=580165 RepID=A0ACC6A7V3_9BACI|nr:glycosyltransferase family 39 protein [Bacillus cytotoxicus]
MGKMQIGFSALFNKVVVGLMFLFFAYSFWYSFGEAKIIFDVNASSLAIVLGVCIILLLLTTSILQYRFTNKQFIIFLISSTVLLRFLSIVLMKAPIESDMNGMYEAAKQVAQGNTIFSSIETVVQSPFIIYESFFIRFFGDATFVLKVCNVLYCGATAYFIYQTASKLFHEECGRIASILYALYIPNIMLCSVFTNEHLATCLFYFACYLLIHKGLSHSYMWGVAAFLFAFSNMIRPLGLFMITVLVLYLALVEVLQSPDRKGMLIRLVGVCVIFYGVHYAVSYAIGTSSNARYIFTNEGYIQSVLVGKNEKKAEQEKKEYNMDFINKKLNEIEKDRFSSIQMSLGNLKKQEMKNALIKGGYFIYMMIAIFAAISMLHLLVQKQENKNYMLFLLIISSYLCTRFMNMHIVYESALVPSLLILQSYGIYMINQYCQKLFFKK